MSLFSAIALLCIVNPGGGNFDKYSFRKTTLQCQKYYVNCYNDEYYKLKHHQSGMFYHKLMSKCINNREI